MISDMTKINGWDVYLKMKEIAGNSGKLHLHADGTYKPLLHINELATAMGLTADGLRDYATALSRLEFIQFTDHTKDTFVITDMER